MLIQLMISIAILVAMFLASTRFLVQSNQLVTREARRSQVESNATTFSRLISQHIESKGGFGAYLQSFKDKDPSLTLSQLKDAIRSDIQELGNCELQFDIEKFELFEFKSDTDRTLIPSNLDQFTFASVRMLAALQQISDANMTDCKAGNAFLGSVPGVVYFDVYLSR